MLILNPRGLMDDRYTIYKILCSISVPNGMLRVKKCSPERSKSSKSLSLGVGETKGEGMRLLFDRLRAGWG